jgi:uncharacterized protein YpuA (DUF1002 family)
MVLWLHRRKSPEMDSQGGWMTMRLRTVLLSTIKHDKRRLGSLLSHKKKSLRKFHQEKDAIMEDVTDNFIITLDDTDMENVQSFMSDFAPL